MLQARRCAPRRSRKEEASHSEASPRTSTLSAKISSFFKVATSEDLQREKVIAAARKDETAQRMAAQAAAAGQTEADKQVEKVNSKRTSNSLRSMQSKKSAVSFSFAPCFCPALLDEVTQINIRLLPLPPALPPAHAIIPLMLFLFPASIMPVLLMVLISLR